MNDWLAMLLLSAPQWVIPGVGLGVVCRSGAQRLQRGQRPGWRPALLAWAASAGILYGPFLLLATVRTPTLWLSATLGPAALSSLPFLAAALVLNQRGGAGSIGGTLTTAASVGVVGLVITSYLQFMLLANLGFEMFP